MAGRYLPNGFSLSDHINISQCLPCTVGKSQNAVASTGCKDCIKGKKADDFLTGIFFIQEKFKNSLFFLTGVYQNEVAMIECKGCTLGLFNDQLQQSSCKHW